MKRDMTGSFRKNDRKEQPNHPDIKGSCVINGTDYWISGWRKEGDSGTWYSLSFKAKDTAPAAAQPSDGGLAKMDDEIPFANPYRGKSSYLV